MVYTGRPSKSCFQCRKRKLRVTALVLPSLYQLTDLKCDLRASPCGQCVRAHIECSGYRDVHQLRIRHETQPTQQKALSRRPVGLQPALSTAIDEQARNAFFSHYVSGFSKTWNILEDLYSQSPNGGYLTVSVDAVSLAFYSYCYHYPPAFELARQRYAEALPLLNQALRCPETATSDLAVLAVLLLDLFEKITNTSPRSTDSWMSHANGAVALIKLRGNDDSKRFQNRTSLRLAVRLMINVIISSVAANTPLPPAVVTLRHELEPYLDKDDPKWRLTGLVVKFCELRESIPLSGMSKVSDMSMSHIVARAKELDSEFQELGDTMPKKWQCQRIRCGKHSGVLEDFVDVYADHHVTQVWNIIRVKRIMLTDLIRLCEISTERNDSPGDSIADADHTAHIIDALARDICASSPQYTHSHHPSGTVASTKSKTLAEILKLQCYTLIFPLYVAGSYASPSSGIGAWVLSQMRFMKTHLSIENAEKVARVLESSPETSPWTVYAILGSYAFAA